MKLRNIAVYFTLPALFMSATTMKAGNTFGFVTEIVNNSGFFVEVTNTDDGHGNMITLNGVTTQIGKGRFTMQPGEKVTANNYVIGWESWGGFIIVNILFQGTNGAFLPVIYKFREERSQIVFWKNEIKQNTGEYAPIDRANDHDLYYRLVITPMSGIKLEKLN